MRGGACFGDFPSFGATSHGNIRSYSRGSSNPHEQIFVAFWGGGGGRSRRDRKVQLP